jgi:hypothetical protein
MDLKIEKKTIKINFNVFLLLVEENYPIMDLKSSKEAILKKEISYSDLKYLANKGNVPLPLFFTTEKNANIQIKNRESYISKKVASKNEISKMTRGTVKINDIYPLIKDISSKQLFLGSLFTGAEKLQLPKVTKDLEKIGSNDDVTVIASKTREYFGIDLSKFSGRSKGYSFNLLKDIIEIHGIYISEATHRDFMPQKIDKGFEFSALCVKDNYFPFIFLNNKDFNKDENSEPISRQILSLFFMIASITQKKYITIANRYPESEDIKRIFSIASEILLPEESLNDIYVSNLSELKLASRKTLLTPSALLMRLKNKISANLYNKLSDALKGEYTIFEGKEQLKRDKNPPFRRPNFENAYKKINSIKFSNKVIDAYSTKNISKERAVSVLFNKPQKKYNSEVNSFLSSKKIR